MSYAKEILSITVVFYRFSIVTTAIYLTIWPKFAVDCLRHSNQQGVGRFGAKLREEWIDLCKPNFNFYLGETWGCCMQKKLCQCLLKFEHNAHRDR